MENQPQNNGAENQVGANTQQGQPSTGVTQPVQNNTDFASLQANFTTLNNKFDQLMSALNRQAPAQQGNVQPQNTVQGQQSFNSTVNPQGQSMTGGANYAVNNPKIAEQLVHEQVNKIVKDYNLTESEFESYFGDMKPDEFLNFAEDITKNPRINNSLNQLTRLRELRNSAQPSGRAQTAGVGAQRPQNSLNISDEYWRRIFPQGRIPQK